MGLNLDTSRMITEAALTHTQEAEYKPLGVVVLDAAGHLITFHREDGASFFRFDIAFAKAWGCLGMGSGSGWIEELAKNRPEFAASLASLSGGKVVPARGGVLVKDAAGKIMGAVGISGDTSERDEECAVAGIEAVGLIAQTD